MGNGHPKPISSKRGANPIGIVSAPPTTATFVDPQPTDRYNLVFFAAYADKDAVLAAQDEAFLRLYHDDFPSALDSRTVWASKAPGSRSHCKADLIQQVASLAEIAVAIKDFIADNRDKPKKFGTILLAGHGSPEEFSLPLATPIKQGGKRLPLRYLEIGLRNIDVLTTNPPKEWDASAAQWKEVSGELLRLKTDLDILQHWLGSGTWTDEQTLMRVWCCNLGKPPKDPTRDPLDIFGKMYFGSGKFMIEAPHNRSGSTFNWFQITPSSPPPLKSRLFKDEKKKNGLWHPDTISEVESDSKLTTYTGANLADAQAEFVLLALRPAPTPNQQHHPWIPVFAVQDEHKRWIFPQEWGAFTKLWRRVAT